MIEEVYIEELEEIAKSFVNRTNFTDRERGILQRYYGRVPMVKLRKTLRRSIERIHREAEALGIPKDRAPLSEDV